MLFRTLITGVILAAGAFAQMSSFPKPSYFRETFQKTQAKVELQDPVKIKDFVVDGKLELSLKNYLALVMANNTNIQLTLLTVETPKNAIQRAFAAWDPLATASFSSQRAKSLPTSVIDANGASVVSSLTQPFSARYSQTLDTGTNYTVTYNASKSSTSNSFATFNPSLSSNLQLQFNQPLLRNRGRFYNRIPLMSARSSFRVADYNMRNSILSLVNTAEGAYWAVILARENVKVAGASRDTQKAYLEYVQKQLDLGAISPLDIFNPKQALAASELALSQAEFNLKQTEDQLRMQLGADLDPAMRTLPIVLTETVDIPSPDALSADAEQSVNTALSNRPDMKAALQRLDVDDLSIQSAKNGLLPNLSLNGLYQTQGRGGTFFEKSLAGAGGNNFTTIPGGFSDALTQMFGFGYPVYSIGLTLNLPIRNRAASMDMADALVRKKTDALALRNTQETVRLNVLNAITNLNGSKEQLKLARIQEDFAKQNVDAELKKYELGTETNQNVILAQQALTQAQFNVVSNQIGLRRSILNLLAQTGELLDQRGIMIQ